MIDFIKNSIPLIVIIGQILALKLIILYFFRNKFPSKAQIVEKYAVLIAFLYAALSMCGSLFYSDILGYEPCKFCWWQRIFMYPLVLILLIAMKKNDVKVYKYVLPMSIIGAIIALNHYILQLTGTSILPCSAVGYSISCSKVFVLSYGYITIPLMAFTAFLGITFAMLFVKQGAKKNA